MDVRDKVVVITGASMGIGEATARAFAQAGAKLVLAARSADKLQALAETLPTESLVVPTDMIQQPQVQALIDQAVERFGRVDILINNAGQGAGGPLATLDLAHYRQIIELNLFGPLYAIQAVVPQMKQQPEGGVIINISSNVSKMAIPGIGAYASTKYALNGLTLTARAELAPDNIRVVLFHPGLTATDFGKNSLRREGEMNYGPRSPSAPPMASRLTPDSAEDVAAKILEAAINEPAETGMPMQTALNRPPVQS